MDNMANASTMRVNDPTPAISANGAAIPHDQPAALSLSAMISQYFVGGMMYGFSWHARVTSRYQEALTRRCFHHK